MTEPLNMTSYLVQAGAAGMVIVVVILFLRFLSEDRVRRGQEHDSFMAFIAQQRKDNNAAIENLSNMITVSLKAMTDELSALRVSTCEHHQFTEDAVSDMRERRKTKQPVPLERRGR